MFILSCKSKSKSKVDHSYRGSSDQITSEPLYNTPLVHWTICRLPHYGAIAWKALARYQIILLDGQRHIRYEQLAQGCCPNSAAVGVEPATSWSRVQRPTTTPPSHLKTVKQWTALSGCSLSVVSDVICISCYVLCTTLHYCMCHVWAAWAEAWLTNTKARRQYTAMFWASAAVGRC